MKYLFTIIYTIPQLPNEKFQKIFIGNSKDACVKEFKQLPETQDATIKMIIPSINKNIEPQFQLVAYDFRIY